MSDSRTPQHLYEYTKNGDGQILYNITKEWREYLGDKGQNTEYKAQYIETIKKLAGPLIDRLKREAKIDCKVVELGIEKTPNAMPGYFLRIDILPRLTDQDEKISKPVLDTVCKHAILLLVSFRAQLIEDAMQGKPGLKL